jgi:exosortase A
VGDVITRDRRILTLSLIAGFVVLGWTYRDVLFGIFEKWQSDAAFSHGILILPISVWLAWRKRAEFSNTEFGPSWLGVLALLLCGAVWFVARGTGVLVIEQFAVVAMIPALVLAVLGWPAAKALAFPLFFLFFMVPFGRGIVPLLMQQTAEVATFGLEWSGVPVYRSYMYISIPGGNFEVARACSGLNFFLTGLVLGTLYANLTYQTWYKRALCVVAFIVFPILLNGVRVYLTILVSYLTDMRFGPGAEHIAIGRIFVVAVLIALMWIGRRWRDEGTSAPPAADAAPATKRFATRWAPLPTAFAAIVAGPILLAASNAHARAALADVSRLVCLPAGNGGWQGPGSDLGRWQPAYHGGLVESKAVYRDSRGAQVDVFVAVYGLGTSLGNEMITYSNVISPQELGSLMREDQRRLSMPDGSTVEARELTVSDNGARRLVWHWFRVGGRPVVDEFAAKAMEAAAFITRSANSERVITLSTPDDADARARLNSFVQAHARCVAAGFAGEACCT